MVHVASTFWVTATIWFATGTSLSRRPIADAWAGPALWFCFSMAVVTRPTNLFLMLVVAWATTVGGSARRAPSWRYLVAALPPLIQMSIWEALFGRWVAYGYGNEGFSWTAPALVQTLWSPRHGLFVWSPLLLLSFLGLAAGWRRLDRERRRFVLVLTGAFIALWYVNSSWETWWFGDAFGGRAFLELAPLYALGLALGLSWLAQAAPATRRLGHALVGVSVLYSYVLMFLYITNRISRSEALF
jgi:hypothetical protein